MRESAGIESQLVELCDQVKELSTKGHANFPAGNQDENEQKAPATDPKKSLKFVDLRASGPPARTLRATWAEKSADYKEKAEDIDSQGLETLINADASNLDNDAGQPSKPEETGEKKKKTKRKKNKKKKN